MAKIYGTELKKRIFFCIDNSSEVLQYAIRKAVLCRCFDNTKKAINKGEECIITSSLANMSFDVIDKGYEMYLCYKDKMVKIEEDMELHDGYTLSRPTYYEDPDILDCFTTGYFDELLDLENKE